MIADAAAKHPNSLLLPTRRVFLRTLAAAGASGRFLLGSATFAEADPGTSLHSEQVAKAVGDSIRPFQVSVFQYVAITFALIHCMTVCRVNTKVSNNIFVQLSVPHISGEIAL